MTNYTTLDNRVLFYDGDTVAKKDYLYELVLSGVDITNNIFPVVMDSEIEQYNQEFGTTITTKQYIREYDMSWNIPTEYQELDIKQKIFDMLLNELSNGDFTESEIQQRIQRTQLEYRLWEKKELLPLLRTLMYIVDTLEYNNLVWGTGRGSSCCCYILYLIGLHDVDSIKYELDLKEFFR